MMSRPKETKTIFISALEPSADGHCARLIGACGQLAAAETFDWVGLGGRQMAAAGCRLLAEPASRAAMLHNVFSQLGYYWRLLRQVEAFFRQTPPAAAVVCDSPAFNFHVARLAKRYGVPVLFYVAPQLWAWAPWRIGKLRRYSDRLACILPFEQQWFCQRGVRAVFVGNPLVEGLTGLAAKSYGGYQPFSATVALLPGSRAAEIHALWPAMLAIARRLKTDFPSIRFLTCAADEQKKELMVRLAGDFPVMFAYSTVFETAQAADVALIASGSATLQTAAAGCPMIVMYQANKWLWHLMGRYLVRIRHLSLINILAERRLVDEFMPYFDSIEPIEQACRALLSDTQRLRQISCQLVELVKPLAHLNASRQTATILLEMLAEVFSPSARDDR